jgi:hypothetical protein
MDAQNNHSQSHRHTNVRMSVQGIYCCPNIKSTSNSMLRSKEDDCMIHLNISWERFEKMNDLPVASND